MPLSTVAAAIEHCARQLDASDICFGHGTDNSWDEAVQLVLHVAGLPAHADSSVATTALDDVQRARLQTLLQRRIQQRVPLPYLTGQAWFAGLPFTVDQRAIIPRSPIAELIGNAFQPWYRATEPSPRVLDLCCGGGCIGLATAVHLPDSRVDLLDIDSQALELARDNARRLQLLERVEILRSDLFEAVAGRRYQLILSNPPYVDAQDLAAMPPEYRHEPSVALGSGADGLNLARRILAQAGAYLAPGGLLVLEVGNSWTALEAALPRVPFTWVEFAAGGHGVLVMTARELSDHAADLI